MISLITTNIHLPIIYQFYENKKKKKFTYLVKNLIPLKKCSNIKEIL